MAHDDGPSNRRRYRTVMTSAVAAQHGYHRGGLYRAEADYIGNLGHGFVAGTRAYQ